MVFEKALYLGSVRTVVDGAGNILEQSDYYPFGGRHKRDDYAFSDNNYRFNGKEEQSNYLGMPELGWTDFGARMYDTRLGKWFNIDPNVKNAVIVIGGVVITGVELALIGICNFFNFV